MNHTVTILLALILVAGFIYYFFNRRFRAVIQQHQGLLDILSVIVSLAVFAQLYYSVQQFNANQADQKEQESARKASANREKHSRLADRLNSVLLEIDVNMKICEILIEKSHGYDPSQSTSINNFHCETMQDLVNSGEISNFRLMELMPSAVIEEGISNRSFGITFWNAIHKMQRMNELMDLNAQILYLQVLEKRDADVIAKINFRLRETMVHVFSEAAELKKSLEACRPLVTAMATECEKKAATVAVVKE